MKKLLALLAALGLCLGLAGCGDKAAEGPAPSESPAPGPVESQAPEAPEGYTPFLAANEVDVPARLLGLEAGSPAVTVNGIAIDAQTCLYWLASMTSYYQNLYFQYTYSQLDLNAEVSEGVTWGERIKEYAHQNVLLTAVAEPLAEKYGVALTDEDMKAVYDQRETRIANIGGAEGFARQLQMMGISDAALFEVDKATTLYDKVMDRYVADALAGAGEGAMTDEDMDRYIEEQDLLRAKHILLLTKDMATGEDYDEAKQAEQLARMEDIAAALEAAEGPVEELFDALMQEDSEDTGLAANPDGYVFTAGQMVTEFEEGTRALAVGEVSPIIKSSYGYHIILRLDADCGETREALATARFNEMVQAMLEEAEVVTDPVYDGVDTAKYYEDLLALQSELQPSPSLEPYEPEEPQVTGE